MFDPAMKYELIVPLLDSDPPELRQYRIDDAHRRMADYPGVAIARTHRHQALQCDLFEITKYPPEVAARVLARERQREQEATHV